MTNLQDKFLNLQAEVSAEVLERNEEIRTGVLALISRKHHFQIGLPGVAKSLLVDRFVERIEMGEADYFKYLMQDFTLPDEIFGPPDIQAFVDDKVYRFVTNGKLPEASIAFLDEIFKANSSILNTLLMIINEREFVNPERIDVPLMSLFSASNELPGDNSLAALWDRIHFRHEVHPLQDSSSFIKMMQSSFDTPEKLLTLDDLREAQAQVREVSVTPDVIETLNALRLELRAENIEPTGRRWRESLGIIQAQAWLNGATSTEVADIRPLIHVLWSEPDHRRQVTQIVLNTVSPLESQGHALLDSVQVIAKELKDIEHDFENDETKLKQALVEIHKKNKRLNVEIQGLREQAMMAEKEIEVISRLEAEFRGIGERMMAHFGKKG